MSSKILLCVAAPLAVFAGSFSLLGQSTAITYQGQLASNATTGSGIFEARSGLDAMSAAKYNTGFWDDFQRANTTNAAGFSTGSLGYAPSISPVTGTNYLWSTLGTTISWAMQIINGEYTDVNGMSSAGYNSPRGCYPEVDLGFKPGYMAAWIKMVPTGGRGVPQELCFISNPSNSLDYALHITIFPGNTINVGLWYPGNRLTNIVYGYQPPSWPGTGGYPWQVNNQVVKIAVRIENDTLSIDWGANTVLSVKDPRIPLFGGRYFVPEIFYAGDLNNSDRIHVLRVEARENEFATPIKTFQTLYVTNGLGVTGGATIDTNRVVAQNSGTETVSNLLTAGNLASLVMYKPATKYFPTNQTTGWAISLATNSDLNSGRIFVTGDNSTTLPAQSTLVTLVFPNQSVPFTNGVYVSQIDWNGASAPPSSFSDSLAALTTLKVIPSGTNSIMVANRSGAAIPGTVIGARTIEIDYIGVVKP